MVIIWTLFHGSETPILAVSRLSIEGEIMAAEVVTIEASIEQGLTDVLKKRALPGIFVVESSGKIVFASDEAQQFLAREAVSSVERHGERHALAKGTLSFHGQLREFCHEVSRPIAVNHNGSQPLTTRRAMLFQGQSGHYYMIVALPLDRVSATGRRKLISLVVQPVGQRRNFDPERLGKLYGLTKREQDVVARLIRGNSNKEIAASLKIQEYTVKDHLKHIMAKCEADSRLNIISKVFLSL
jgi:DNA-binding CsgD family transcriptional regulator